MEPPVPVAGAAAYEADRAVLEREHQLRELEDYRRDRIEQEAEFIMPELRDFITGSSPQEIDASIEAIKARTEADLRQHAGVTDTQPSPEERHRQRLP